MAAKKEDMMKQFNEWMSLVEQDLKSLAETGTPMRVYKHSKSTRMVGKWCVAPCCCAPCIVWSCIGRIVMCPFTCGKSIAGNALTSNSDGCVFAYCEKLNERVIPQALVPYDLKWVATDKDLRVELNQFVNKFCDYVDSSFFKLRMIAWLQKQLDTLGFEDIDFTAVTPNRIREVALKAINTTPVAEAKTQPVIVVEDATTPPPSSTLPNDPFTSIGPPCAGSAI